MAGAYFRGLRPGKPQPTSREPGEVNPAGCAGVWFGALRAGGFLPVEAAGGCKTVACAYFRGRGACTQYDPEVILSAKTLDPEGDAYYDSWESQNVSPISVCVCAKALDATGDLYHVTKSSVSRL